MLNNIYSCINLRGNHRLAVKGDWWLGRIVCTQHSIILFRRIWDIEPRRTKPGERTILF